MTPEEYQCESCNFGKDGAVCALHGVEVERRRNSDTMLKLLTDAVQKLSVTVESLSSFKYMALGVAIIGMTLVLGSYYFTSDTKRDLAIIDALNMSKLELISVQVSSLTTAVAVIEARHIALLEEIEHLCDLIGAQETRGGYKVNDPRGTLEDDRYN